MARFRSTIRSGLLYAPPLRRLVDQRDELQGTVESLVALVEQRDATIAEERGQLAQARRDRDELRARASGLTDRIRELERALLDLRRRAPGRPHQTVFQGFWHGPPLDVVLRACLQSFIEQGHAFHLYVYEPVDVPDGVVLMDANEVIPFEEIFYYRDPTTGRKDLGPFSDLFRFRLLDMRGGWWVDVDTVCLSSHIPQADSAWAREFPEYSPAALGTSSIALSEGSDLAKTLHEEYLALSP